MEEKPFEPSQKKLREARAKGEVAKSPLFALACLTLGSLLLLFGLKALFYERLVTLMKEGLSLDQSCSIEQALFHLMRPFVFPLLLFAGGTSALAIFAHMVQTGPLFSWQRLKPKWVAKRERRLLYSFTTALIKIGLLGAMGWIFFRMLHPTALWIFQSTQAKLFGLLRTCWLLATAVAAALVVIGSLDWIYQKWFFMRKMRMTAREKQEEAKESSHRKTLQERK